jgi:hypothetical protein
VSLNIETYDINPTPIQAEAEYDDINGKTHSVTAVTIRAQGII